MPQHHGPDPKWRQKLRALLDEQLAKLRRAAEPSEDARALGRAVAPIAQRVREEPARALLNEIPTGVATGLGETAARFVGLFGGPDPNEAQRATLLTPPDTPTGRLGHAVGALAGEMSPAGDFAAPLDALAFLREGSPGMAALAAAGGAPLIPNVRRLRHFGAGIYEDAIDPKFQGRGRAGAERERAEMPDYVARSYYYNEGAEPERIFQGRESIEVEYPADKILDEQRFRDYVGRAEQQLRASGELAIPGRVLNLAEKLAVDEGWHGIDFGRATQMFVPIPTGSARLTRAPIPEQTASFTPEQREKAFASIARATRALQPSALSVGRGVEQNFEKIFPSFAETGGATLPREELLSRGRGMLRFLEDYFPAPARGATGPLDEFGNPGLSDAEVAARMSRPDLQSSVLRAHEETGGATFDPRTGANMVGQQKWAVATPAIRVLDKPLGRGDLASFLEEHRATIESDPRSFVGTWRDPDTGKSEVNITQLFDTREEAMRVARERGEKAIFDLGKLETENVAPVVRGAAESKPRTLHQSAADRERSMLSAKNLEGTIAEIEGGLSPEEIEIFRNANKGTRERIMKSYARAPSPRTLASAALEGAPQFGWYKASRAALKESFGEDAPRFAALLASLSPQRPVKSNMKDALKMWGDWTRAGRPTDPEKIAELVPRAAKSWRSTVPNAVTSLTAGAADLAKSRRGFLSGPKVDPFYANLVDDPNRVVLDTHMARGLGTGPNDIGQLSRNIASTAAVRNAAAEASRLSGGSIDPESAQEMIWSYIYGARDLAGRGSVEEALSKAADRFGPSELQKAVADAPSFDVLLQDPEMQELLAYAGGKVPGAVARPDLSVPSGAVRFEDLLDIARRVDAVKAGRPLFTGAGLLGGAAAARGLLGDERPTP